jgi:dCMP deaminase
MPLTYRTETSSPLIRWEAKCDNPSCPTGPYSDAIHPQHVEPPLTDIEQINRYMSNAAAKKGFAERDGSFYCDACYKVTKRGNRPTWDEYFMDIAHAVATRATCDRKHVGCVLVRDRNILASGYNGSITGLDDCDTKGHLMEEGHCSRTVHAEVNALAQAAKNGVRIADAVAYVTALPCWGCTKTLLNAGVVRVCFDEAYRPDPKVAKACAEKGVNLVQVSPRR